jgi:hypothetical protein
MYTPGFITFTPPGGLRKQPYRRPSSPARRRTDTTGARAVRRGAGLLCLVHLCLLAVAAPARADEEHPAIAAARGQLHSYDLEGSRTTDVLAELGRFDRTAYLNELRRARFLRAAAAADLLLLAHLKNLPELTARIASAYGVDEDRILPHVRAELAAVRVGVYTPIVDDAAGALDRMAGIRGQRVAGPRADAFYVHDVLVAARRDDPQSALAHLTSREADVPFDRVGRRAVAAVTDAFAALERLADAATHGDPFAAQLVDELPARTQALRDVVLEPLPALDESLGLGRVEHGTAVRPDLVLSVHPTEVRFSFMPRVTFTDGSPALTSERQPTFPAVETVPLEELAAWPRPVDALVEALRSRIDEETAIALGGAPEAEAHLLTRVWQSVVRAGGQPRWLVARDAHGLLAGISARATREAVEGTEVFVRLGGHSVSRRGARSTSIPRERTGQGWRHDWEQLARTVRGPAALRYMSVVPLQTLVETAFVVGEEVTLDFP